MTNSKTDKRTQQANTGYKGKKCPKDAFTCAYLVKVRDAVKDSKEYDALCRFFDYKAAKFQQDILDQPNVIQWALDHVSDLARGHFRKGLIEAAGKPYLTHKTKGNNAWYFYNDSALLESATRSFLEKRVTAEVCQEFSWDTDKTTEICEEIHNRSGKWVSHQEIRNTCASESIPQFNTDMAYSLDYSTQCHETIEDWEWDQSQPFEYHQVLKIGDDRKRIDVHIDYRVPERIILQPYVLLDVRKPKLFRDSVTGELMMSVPYWYRPRPLALGDGALGGDLGVCRVMKCGVVFPDGRFIETLALSREVERLHAHILVLMENKRGIYEKYERLSRLVAYRKDVGSDEYERLSARVRNLYKNYSEVKSNIAGERESLAFLIARDVLVLARQYGAGVVRVERLSWVGGSGQSWDFSSVIRAIERHANRYGVRVERVSAYKSSQFDPSGVGVPLRVAADTVARVCVWSDGSVHDRDDSASVELGCRDSKYSVSHDRDAVVSCDVVGESRVFCPEARPVRRRGRGRDGQEKRSRYAMGRPFGCDLGLVPDLSGFYASIRERRAELAAERARVSALGGVFDVCKFVAELSSTVAVLCECRSVLSGEPACSSGAVPTVAAKNTFCLTPRR